MSLGVHDELCVRGSGLGRGDGLADGASERTLWCATVTRHATVRWSTGPRASVTAGPLGKARPNHRRHLS